MDLKFAKAVILRLSNEGSVLKSSLQNIVSNLYSLDKLLSSLQGDGLVEIELMKFGKNITKISLTEKGRQVAEQLKNAELASQGRLVKSFFSIQMMEPFQLGMLTEAYW